MVPALEAAFGHTRHFLSFQFLELLKRRPLQGWESHDLQSRCGSTTFRMR
jgi:hypothetical protein